jgi:hypothetical protein
MLKLLERVVLILVFSFQIESRFAELKIIKYLTIY